MGLRVFWKAEQALQPPHVITPKAGWYTAVCGHSLTAASVLAQVDHPEGTEFESSDTNVYFVKAGHVQLRAAEKQLEEAQVRQTVAQAAVAVQTMAPTGPLSKVIIDDGYN